MITGIVAQGAVGEAPPPPAGIQYVGGKTAVRTGGDSTWNVPINDLTGGLSSAPQEGDLVIVAYAHTDLSTVDPLSVSGYDEQSRLTLRAPSNTYRCVQVVYSKIMSSVPDTSISVAHYSNNSSLVVQVFRGVDITTPFDVTRTTATGASNSIGSGVNPPAITPVTEGALIVAVGSIGAGYGAAVLWDNDLDNYIQDGTNGGSATNNYTATGIGQHEWDGSGAYDPPAWTLASGTNAGGRALCMVTMALRPAP